jgi:ribonuclease VapC
LIVIDSSPLIAILKDENEGSNFWNIIASADQVMLGAANKLEVMMVAAGYYGPEGKQIAQELLDRGNIEVIPLSEELADIATEAFLQYGRGRNHPAKLNFGDCMAYALAKTLDSPLLFKGDDFSKTDIRSAL